MPRIPQGFLQDVPPDGWTAVDNTVNEGELRRRDMRNDKSKKRRVLPVDYSCIPESKDRAFIVIDDPVKDKDDVNKEIRREALKWYDNSKKKRKNKDTITTARDLLLSSLLSISAVPVSAFPEDEQKTVLITLKEITERIRGLRRRLS